MAQHLLVVGPGGLVPGRQHHEEVVEVVPPAGRTALDQREVVGGEDRHPEQVQPIAAPGQRMTVDQHPVATGGPQLGVEGLVPALVLDRRPHDRLVLTVAHEGRVRDRPGTTGPSATHATASSSVVLPAPLAPSMTVTPGPKASCDVLVPPEVAQLERAQVHRRGDPVGLGDADGHQQVQEVG